MFPHYNVDEEPKKRPKKGYFPKRRESEDKGAVAIPNSVSQMGCVSQDSDALASQGMKEFRGNPMQKVLNAIQRVRFGEVHATSREYPGQERTIAWKNTSQTSTSAKSLRYKNSRDRSHEETERQERCAQSKAWDLAKNICQARSERQGYNLLACRKIGSPKCLSKRAGGKRVSGRFRSEYAYGQQARPSLC